MVSCYSPKQPTSYSLVDVTDSLGLAFPLPASVLTGTKITGANESKSKRSSSFLKKLLLSSLYFWMAVSLFFVFSSNCKRFFVLTPPPPSLPAFCYSIFITRDDYTSLSRPYLFISTEPTPNYAHQSWRGGVEGGTGFGLSFKCHQTSCCWEREL